MARRRAGVRGALEFNRGVAGRAERAEVRSWQFGVISRVPATTYGGRGGGGGICGAWVGAGCDRVWLGGAHDETPG